MKNFAIFALIAGVVACGQNSEHSDLSARQGSRLAKVYSFSVDNRPADGNFESIIVKKDKFGTFSANYRVITAGFGFPVSDTTEELGTTMECVETKRGQNLKALKCSVDMRPADGALTELTLTKTPEGLYNATVRKATYSTLQGPATDETTELAFGLTYKR